MPIENWLAFSAASIVLVLIPGPTVMLVLSYAISHGRKVAFATASGVALGDFIAITASLAGLGALVLTSATLFTILKWIGAAYLVFLGVRLLINPPASAGLEGPSPAAASRSGPIRARCSRHGVESKINHVLHRVRPAICIDR